MEEVKKLQQELYDYIFESIKKGDYIQGRITKIIAKHCYIISIYEEEIKFRKSMIQKHIFHRDELEDEIEGLKRELKKIGNHPNILKIGKAHILKDKKPRGERNAKKSI